jgi:hypothetical protein
VWVSTQGCSPLISARFFLFNREKGVVGGNRGGEGTRTGNKINSSIHVHVFNSQLTRLYMTQKILKRRILFNLWSSLFQSFPHLSTLTRFVVIPFQRTLICMELYWVFPNLGIHFKPTLPLIENLKKISLMLPIMATTKKNRCNPTKIWFLGTPRKNAFHHKVLSRALARSQTLGRNCISLR